MENHDQSHKQNRAYRGGQDCQSGDNALEFPPLVDAPIMIGGKGIFVGQHTLQSISGIKRQAAARTNRGFCLFCVQKQ